MDRGAFEMREPVFEAAPRDGEKVENRTIGRILVDLGKLRERDATRVFAFQRKRHLLFGEAARKLGLVDLSDVNAALAIQFNFPYLQRGQGTLGTELVTAHEPGHAHSEAVREVRTHLLTRWLSPERKVLVVASPASGDGRSYLAANLAVSFAQLGTKTLLIDGDLRAPRLHRIFGLGGGSGLAQVLAGGLGLSVAERIAYFDELMVLAAGAAPPNPVELLSRSALQRLLAEARKLYTVVIIDTPSRARGADASLLAARADGALLLARTGWTRLVELDALRRTMAASGAAVLGVVLSDE
ncbi:MAG: polysaccharide biosynthesis tyrosine autokinase [Sphingomonadaceae bacterium]